MRVTRGTIAGLGAEEGHAMLLILKNTLAVVLRTSYKGIRMEIGRLVKRCAIIQMRDG